MIDSHAMLNWVFIPFVHPDREIENLFGQAVRQFIGPAPSNPKQFRDWVFDLVKHRGNRQQLRGCYHAAKVDVNAMSMSLYSGPAGKVPFRAFQWLSQADGRDWMSPFRPQCGWLATGDSNLFKDEFRNALLNHYSRVVQLVGTMTVPHHGSRLNYHESIATLGPRHFVVTARTGNRHHPHGSVKRSLNGRLHHVSQIEGTYLEEEVVIWK